MAEKRGTIVYEGIRKVINGKAIFMRQCLCYKDVVKTIVENLEKGTLPEGLQHDVLYLRDRGVASLTFNEKNLEDLFDQLFLGKMARFKKESNDKLYELYTLPMSRNGEEIQLDVTYPMVYGIVNNDRCRAAIAAEIKERDEYYACFEQSEYRNPYFEGFFRAEQIWDARLLLGLLDRLRRDRKDGGCYRQLMRIIYAGYGYLKRQLKARNVITGTMVQEILRGNVPAENAMLSTVSRMMLLMVMAEDMGIPYEWDYNTLVMLHFFESSIDQLTNGESAYGDLTDFETDQREFFQKYDEKYSSHSSLLGMLREGELEQMADLVLRIFGLYQMSPIKFWGYDLSEEETRCLMRQRERWSQRTYATGLILAQLCKYIRQLEEQSLLASKDYAGMQLQIAQREKEELCLRQKQKERELEQLALEKRRLQDTILKQEQELRRLQKQAAEQKQQIAAQQTELGEMRSYLYSLSEGREEGNGDACAETKLPEWSEKKVLVVGGHTNWQNKLRELFPKWQFISAGQNSLDDKMIRGKDCIICNTEVLAHSCYYKILSGRERRQKLCYVHSNNIQKCLRELAPQLGV